jgi:hypothetical protein
LKRLVRVISMSKSIGFAWRAGRGGLPRVLLATVAASTALLIATPGAASAAAGSTGQATAHTAPHGHHGRAVTPASLGRGLGKPAKDVTPAEASTCATAAYKAGFPFVTFVDTPAGNYRSVVVAIAVGLAESSCNPLAQGVNGPTSGCPNGSVDRGLWQINNCYHPNVSDACAYQAQCNGDAAWTISNHGTDWEPWSTYDSGAWEGYIKDAENALAGFRVMLEGNASGKCLEAKPGTGRNGGVVQLWQCESSNNYEWWTIIQGAPSANPVLDNVASGHCLDTTGTTGIQQYDCNTTMDASQRWWVNGSGALHPDGASLYTLQNSGSGKCLATVVGQGVDGGPVKQEDCNSNDSYQQWN